MLDIYPPQEDSMLVEDPVFSGDKDGKPIRFWSGISPRAGLIHICP